ncbi:MAG TPA: hypothetical protein VHM90_07070 [Phycisphaerae bacterium]|jgi:hypothetical protein|nr:hypothetical protein [Phycisphaerae bacterium]
MLFSLTELSILHQHAMGADGGVRAAAARVLLAYTSYLNDWAELEISEPVDEDGRREQTVQRQVDVAAASVGSALAQYVAALRSQSLAQVVPPNDGTETRGVQQILGAAAAVPGAKTELP